MSEDNQHPAENQSSGTTKKFKKRTAAVIILIVGAIVLVLGAMYFLPGTIDEKETVKGTTTQSPTAKTEPKAYEYSEEFISNYNKSCLKASEQNGVTDTEIAGKYCDCTLNQIMLNYPEDEYSQIESALNEQPDAAPDKLVDLLTICYRDHIPEEQTRKPQQEQENNPQQE